MFSLEQPRNSAPRDPDSSCDAPRAKHLHTDAQDTKYYSILPDLATGWRPKNMKIAAPIIITYEENLTASVYHHYIGFMSKLLYIGPRHENSYKFHSLTQHGYSIRYGLKYNEIPLKLQREMEDFTIKTNGRKPPFVGMSPLAPSPLKFDSNFESGNLDLVIHTSQNEYNLFLRPDTNTCGHMQWFYFKLTHLPQATRTVRINICNNRRAMTLFTRGMRPFAYSRHVLATQGIKWQQAGSNVSYQKLATRDLIPKELVNLKTGVPFESDQLDKYNCLSFDYTFEADNDEVYFAYCPPYTYTEMRQHIRSLRKAASAQSNCFFHEQVLGSSMSGLEIPSLTITDESAPEQDKKCIVAMARIHSGESNGSYVMKGFLDFLVSAEAEDLRRRAIFKVIPMINPDGVVFGNYRTGLAGKDLNRKFKTTHEQLFPEVTNLKEFVTRLKKEGHKLTYFLDFHGHSVKKNVFTYGPEYDVWTNKYERSKALPRILALKTSMFRLQSCIFRVAAGKKSTARAFMLGMIPYCYTIQSSVGLFREKGTTDVAFDPIKWSQMGFTIGEGLRDTINKLFEQFPLKERRKKKNIQPLATPGVKSRKQTMMTAKEPSNEVEMEGYRPDTCKQDKENMEKRDKSFGRINSSASQHRSNSNKSIRSHRNEQERLKPCKLATVALALEFPQIAEVQEKQEESDGFSEGKSDCESDDNDLDKEKYKNLSGKIMKFIQNFNKSIVGLNRTKMRIKDRPKNNRKQLNKSKADKGNKSEEIKFVPSLRYRLAKRQLSEKTIEDNLSLKSNKPSFYRAEEDKRRTSNASDLK